MNHLDEIRAKLGIEELVSGYLQLKKAGRNLKGLCPFHNDSRPSFMVSPEKGIAYCFSCNTGGDIFKFIQLIERVEFPEAVRILADRTGVRLPEFRPEARDERLELFEINQKAAEFFHQQLKNNTQENYFLKRGLKEEVIDQFLLGYAPDSYSTLKGHLLALGYSEAQLLKAGLLNQRSIADKNTYDRFRNRYMFPIWDHQGNIVGFGGRIAGEGEPKYLNSPDTPIYNKSLLLYGLNFAKDSIKKNNRALFVEGYMDVITCHQAGSTEAIATSGTALTPAQLKLIKRYTDQIAFAFDQDTAGMDAAHRAIELAREAGLEPQIISIPVGKDPDECIKTSLEAWQKAVSSPLPAMDFYFEHAFRLHDKNTLQGKKAILDRLLPLIKAYPSAMEQDEYLKRLALELQTETKFLWEDLKKTRISPPTHPVTYTQEAQKNNLSSSFEKNPETLLLAFILHYPELSSLLPILPRIESENPFVERIYTGLKKVYDLKGKLEPSLWEEEFLEEEKEKIKILSLLIDELYPDLNLENAEKETQHFINMLQKKQTQSLQKELIFKIRMAQTADERNSLFNQYNEILKSSYH